MPSPRAILHVDMDAFYASIEQRDNPELRGKPVLVAGSSKKRGVVSAASYEARAFGCHSAQPTAIALRNCPHAVVVRGRMDEYVRVSRQIAEIFQRFTPLVEPLSIDEAFLDVTGSQRLFGSANDIAAQIKQAILDTTQLTASVGVAPNKFVAKLASDHDKPDGLVVVTAAGMQAFLDALPIGRMWGAGRATLPKFEKLQIRTFGDARRLTEAEFTQHFGATTGPHFWRLVRGMDERCVHTDRDAKSISHEQTFAEDIGSAEILRGILLNQVEQVARRLRLHERTARTVQLKIRRGDFHTITRAASLRTRTDRTDAIWRVARAVFDDWCGSDAASENNDDPRAKSAIDGAFGTNHRSSKQPSTDSIPWPVRLIGVGVSQLTDTGGEQLDLFETPDHERSKRRDQVADQISARFGKGAIRRAASTTRKKARQNRSDDT